MVAYDWGTGGIKKKKFGEDTEAPTNSFGGVTDILKQTGLVNNNDISSLTKNVNRATGAVKDFLNPDSKLNLWNFTQPKSQRDKEAAYKQLNDSVTNYKGSFSDQLNAITDKINNREPFKYDLSGDTVFQNAKDQYLKQAKLGMTDAMAQAAALSGGYGNSYAQQAGYQAYQNNLDSLNDMIPGLYEAAMQRYKMEGDDLYNRYGMLADRDNQEYQRLLGNRDFAYNDWANERDYQTALNQYKQQMMYQGLRDLVGDAKWGTEFGWGAGQDLFSNGMNIAKFGLDAGTSIYDRLYQAAQDKIANDFRQRQLDEDIRQYNENNRLNWEKLNEERSQNREAKSQWEAEFALKNLLSGANGTGSGSTGSSYSPVSGYYTNPTGSFLDDPVFGGSNKSSYASEGNSKGNTAQANQIATSVGMSIRNNRWSTAKALDEIAKLNLTDDEKIYILTALDKEGLLSESSIGGGLNTKSLQTR